MSGLNKVLSKVFNWLGVINGKDLVKQRKATQFAKGRLTERTLVLKRGLKNELKIIDARMYRNSLVMTLNLEN